jgi:hypothetical protein
VSRAFAHIRSAFRIVELADHVARDDEVGGFCVRQRGARLAALVCHVAQPRAAAAKIERQRAQRAVGIQQRKICQ